MERKPQDKGHEESGRQSDEWRARVAADLLGYRDEQQRLWGGIDEMMLARYDAGVSPEAERIKIEQAMRDHPALRECMEIDRQITAEWQASASVDDSRPKRQGDKPWVDRSDGPQSEPGKPR